MTQEEFLLSELLSGRPVTTPTSIKAGHGWRIAAAVHRLRQSGAAIATRRGPRGVAVYHLLAPSAEACRQPDLFDVYGGAS